MNRPDIEAMKKALKELSPWPWGYWREPFMRAPQAVFLSQRHEFDDGVERLRLTKRADAIFIAESPEKVADLIAWIEELERNFKEACHFIVTKDKCPFSSCDKEVAHVPETCVECWMVEMATRATWRHGDGGNYDEQT